MLFKTMEFYVHLYVSLQIRNNEKVTTATINRMNNATIDRIS